MVHFLDLLYLISLHLGLPWCHGVESRPAAAVDAGSIPGQEDSQEKEMATHSSILAWEIPWTEEPGRRGYSSWGQT